MTEHKHILRTYRESKDYKHKVQTTVNCVNVKTIFYS